jgi:short-subunit dehydrogenase
MSLPRPRAGSCALVTGASSGIGLELARGLAARGHAVALAARRDDRLEWAAGDIADRHRVRAEPLAVDLIEPAERAGLARQLEELGLRVDVLVNNAGFGFGGPFHESDLEREIEQLRVLCEVPIALMRTFLPGMVERREGAVINMASTAGMQPLPNSAGYAAAKAHMLSFTEAVHMEVRRLGVTVTAVCPGPVFTELFDKNYHPVVRVPRALWLQADEVAEAGLRGAERGRRVVIPGAVIRAGAPLLRIAPRMVALRVAERAFR